MKLIDPIPDKLWNSRLEMFPKPVSSIVFDIGYHRDGTPREIDMVDELNWNPHVIDETGNKIYYQRDFCWTIEQKQLLIESIYNGLDCGKVIVRKRPVNDVIRMFDNDEYSTWMDLVDGKQRLNAIIEFMTDKFTDTNGIFYSQFSKEARHKFGNRQVISFGVMGEASTDSDTIAVFLNINFTGVQMSKEHIEFVKAIKLS